MSEIQDRAAALRDAASLRLIIDGPTELVGSVAVQGSKNASLRLIAATLAVPGTYVLQRLPHLIDVLDMLACIEHLGAKVRLDSDAGTCIIDTSTATARALPPSLTRSTTASFYLAGAILGRFGEMAIGRPGGDRIGPRPVNMHLEVFRALGAKIREDESWVYGHMRRIVSPLEMTLPAPSTGVCINTLLAVHGGRGRATIHNAPIDAEINSLLDMIMMCGTEVRTNQSTIRVDATNATKVRGVTVECPPDRNDAFTWLAAGSLSRLGVSIAGVNVKDLQPGIDVLKSLGIDIEQTAADSIHVRQSERAGNAVGHRQIIAGPSPGFHSDWLPLLHTVLTQLPGESSTIETLYPNRIRQAEILRSMGAAISVRTGFRPGDDVLFERTSEVQYRIDVTGPTKLRGIATSIGNDIRACAAIVLAATYATGTTDVSECGALGRGYDKFNERLRGIGAQLIATS